MSAILAAGSLSALRQSRRFPQVSFGFQVDIGQQRKQALIGYSEGLKMLQDTTPKPLVPEAIIVSQAQYDFLTKPIPDSLKWYGGARQGLNRDRYFCEIIPSDDLERRFYLAGDKDYEKSAESIKKLAISNIYSAEAIADAVMSLKRSFDFDLNKSSRIADVLSVADSWNVGGANEN